VCARARVRVCVCAFVCVPMLRMPSYPEEISDASIWLSTTACVFSSSVFRSSVFRLSVFTYRKRELKLSLMNTDLLLHLLLYLLLIFTIQIHSDQLVIDVETDIVTKSFFRKIIIFL